MFIVYIIAGELSGDEIGAEIISLLKARFDKEIQIEGVGGPKMLNAGLTNSLFEMSQISIMGYAEVLFKILKLNRLINKTVNDIIIKQPDLIITIDSPGFCYRVAKKVSEQNLDIKMVHIVAPSVWAYKENRAKLFADIYKHLFVILPFEPPYFEKYGLQTTYIGHPSVNRKRNINRDYLKEKYNIPNNTPILTLMAGSRNSEISKLLPIFLKTAYILKERIADLRICIICATDSLEKITEKLLAKNYLEYFAKYEVMIETRERKFDIISGSNAVLAKSGTNNIEIALCEVPFVVAYKMNWLTWLYVKNVIKIKYASLINILANEEIVPEFIQNDCDPVKMSNALHNFITNPALAKAQIFSTNKVLSILASDNNTSPAQKAFIEICKILTN